MKCKDCGHTNRAAATKCAACGVAFETNEWVEMFQAQAQSAKGLEVSLNGQKPMEFKEETLLDAESFFSLEPLQEISPSPKPTPFYSPPPEEEESQFFEKHEAMVNPIFETKVESLRPEEEKPLPEHPVYSPPTNPLIETFIAKLKKVLG